MTDVIPALLDLAKQQQVNVASSVSVSSGRIVTGIIPAAGTTAIAGTGFTYTHTNGTGVYVVSFTVAFTTAPIVQLTSASSGRILSYATKTASGFTCNIWNSLVAAVDDQEWNFLAIATQ